MKEVPLHGAKARGRVALVDESDYPLVAPRRWFVMEQKRRDGVHGPYARANLRRADGTRTSLYMHRLITGWDRTDHRDGNGLNNQRANLRAATDSQNQANQRKRTAETTSQYKGVSWDRRARKWQVFIGVAGEHRYLGYFASEADAARAYNAAAEELFGEFALLNEVATTSDDVGCMCGMCTWCLLCMTYGDPMPVPPGKPVTW